VHSIHADGLGNIVASGWFSGAIDLGNGQVPSSGNSVDFFVAKLGSNGSPTFIKAIGDSAGQYELFCALDPAGNVLLAGNAEGTVDFGGGPLPPSANNASEVVAAKLDATGAHVWSSRFAKSGNVLQAGDVAADAAGNAHVIGSFSGSVDFGLGLLSSTGQVDVFLLEYGPSGLPVSVQKFGDVADQYGSQVEIDPLGAPVIDGLFYGSIDFGDGALLAGPGDVFVAKLAP
jgi:hypothetical protein